MPSFKVDVEGKGAPVILIPGLGCSSEVWRETVAHLNEKEFQTHALTIAGFGGTKPISTDHLLNTVRDDIAAYIEQNKLDHPNNHRPQPWRIHRIVTGRTASGFDWQGD